MSTKFQEYVLKNDIVMKDFADKCGVHVVTLYHLLQGKTVRIDTAKKIAAATNGALVPTDFGIGKPGKAMKRIESEYFRHLISYIHQNYGTLNGFIHALDVTYPSVVKLLEGGNSSVNLLIKIEKITNGEFKMVDMLQEQRRYKNRVT